MRLFVAALLFATALACAPSARADGAEEAAPPPDFAPEPLWAFALGPEGGFISGVAPTVAPTAGISYSFALRSPRLLAPSFHMSADVAGAEHGGSSFRWVGGTLRACPIHALLIQRRLRLAPCASLQIAWHYGVTSGAARSAQSELWLAPIAGASALYVMTQTSSLELHGGAVFPLERNRFVLPPDTTIFEVPAVAATAMLTLHLRFF